MDGTEIAAGSASLMSAVQNLRKRANEATLSANAAASAGNDSGKDGGNVSHRPVDIVRKLDLLQKLSDASNGSGGGGGGGDGHGAGEELSLQDRVFHSMVLEKLPDFSKLGPSPLARGVASGPAGSTTAGEKDEGTPAPRGGAAAAQMQLERQQAAAAAAARKVDKKSWSNRPGAKRHTKGKAGGLSEVKEIVIPLGPERLSNIEIHRILKNEFAVRYCETLNIAPTAANVSDINRRMPLSQCVIRQVIHPGLGRGERKNYVSIIPPCYKPLLQREAHRRQEEQRASLGLEPDVDPRDVQPFESMARAHHQGTGGSGEVPTDTPSAAGGSGGGAYAGPSFDDYKHRFVHPFNLASRFEADPDSALTSTSTLRATAGGAHSASATHQQAGGTSRGGTFGRMTVGSVGTGGGHGDMRRTARAARTELDESQTVEHSRKAVEHQRRVASYDDALAKLKRGEKLDATNVDSIRKAVADERPLAVTAAHIQALDDMLGAADDDGVQRHDGHPFHQTHNATLAPTAPPRSAGTASIANARVHAADPRARQADAAAQREVDAFQHPSGIAEVRALQSLFIRDFPFGSYFADKDEIVCLKAGLSADDVTDVVVAMLRFLFSAYIAPRASEIRSVASAPTDVDDAFVSFYSKVLQLLYTSLGAHPEAAAARSNVQRDAATASMGGTIGATGGTALHGARSLQSTGRKHSTATVAPTPPAQSVTPGYGGDAPTVASASGASPARLAPMIVLLCRVAIDKELRSHVPTLLRSPAGAELAVCVDNLVMAILDPLNLLSHISVVESTPHAMRILQSKRRPGRIPPMLTSPLTHFVLGEPQSANAKTMARSNLPRLQRGLRELQKHLTPLARSRLLQAMVSAKFGGDSTQSH